MARGNFPTWKILKKRFISDFFENFLHPISLIAFMHTAPMTASNEMAMTIGSSLKVNGPILVKEG